MAWSAPTEWERWNPDQILQCPYNGVHRIPAKRYQYHILKCREQYPEKDFVTCPFNAKHVMLRAELRQHIARCTDKGEIEPYSYKGCEQDIEGFYFKGDTSVPCYRREEMSIPPRDAWDRDDDETTTQQNLCEYYKQKQEDKTPAVSNNQGIQDVLSVQHDERERFKDSMRNSAVQQHSSYHGSGYYSNQLSSQVVQQSTININTSQARPIYQPSSNNNNGYHGNQSSHMSLVQSSSQPSHDMSQVRPIYQPLSSDNNSFFGNQSSAQAQTHPSHNMSSTRLSYNHGYNQPSHLSSAQAYTKQSSSYNSYYHSNQPAYPISAPPSSFNSNHTFRGAGRARLVEEAKRSQFGINSIMGRGRGMLGYQ